MVSSFELEFRLKTFVQGENKFIDGTEGDDRLFGSSLNNMFFARGGNNFVNGGKGDDSVCYSEFFPSRGVNVNLTRGIARNESGGRDRLISIENVDGSSKADRLNGNADRNVLWGLDGNDFISGRGGDDLLAGGRGADTLIGGRGRDSFAYAFPESGGDIIRDFQVGQDKLLIVEEFFFSGMSGSKDSFSYNRNNGRIIYDPDGVGGQSGTVIATLSNRPNFTESDISIV